MPLSILLYRKDFTSRHLSPFDPGSSVLLGLSLTEPFDLSLETRIRTFAVGDTDQNHDRSYWPRERPLGLGPWSRSVVVSKTRLFRHPSRVPSLSRVNPEEWNGSWEYQSGSPVTEGHRYRDRPEWTRSPRVRTGLWDWYENRNLEKKKFIIY